MHNSYTLDCIDLEQSDFSRYCLSKHIGLNINKDFTVNLLYVRVSLTQGLNSDEKHIAFDVCLFA